MPTVRCGLLFETCGFRLVIDPEHDTLLQECDTLDIVQIATTLLSACDGDGLLVWDWAIQALQRVPITKENQDGRTVHLGRS